MHEKTVFIFSNDLRLRDHPALLQAASESRQLLCLYCVDPAWFKPARYQSKPMGAARWRFIHQSVDDLQQALGRRQQKLLVCYLPIGQAVERLVVNDAITAVYRSQTSGYQENRLWQRLQQRWPDVVFKEIPATTLFNASELPFTLDDLPETFSQFRKQVERLPIALPLSAPDELPPPISVSSDMGLELPEASIRHNTFEGGESAGIAHLKHYFSTLAPSRYKETRNDFYGEAFSTGFSSWLSQGCLSPRQIVQALTHYESDIIANESTYWILFELLWREYFQWYALKQGVRLFALGGIRPSTVRGCFYPERFQKWCAGNTPWPIVNACMKELASTGWLSNRGRQLVASCLIHELGMDWRYGAAWFEEQLIDYDVASNWGNWQYLAEVGADSRGSRHFNLEKQAQQYDPDGHYIKRWFGDRTYPLDSVDMADWPILPDNNDHGSQ